MFLKKSVFKNEKSLGKIPGKVNISWNLYMLQASILKIKQINACPKLTVETLNK